MTKRVEFLVPDDEMEAKCRSCGAVIVFAKQPTGKLMPLDIASVEWRDGKRYAESHFSKCPNADRFRKSRRRAY